MAAPKTEGNKSEIDTGNRGWYLALLINLWLKVDNIIWRENCIKDLNLGRKKKSKIQNCTTIRESSIKLERLPFGTDQGKQPQVSFLHCSQADSQSSLEPIIPF